MSKLTLDGMTWEFPRPDDENDLIEITVIVKRVPGETPKFLAGSVDTFKNGIKRLYSEVR